MYLLMSELDTNKVIDSLTSQQNTHIAMDSVLSKVDNNMIADTMVSQLKILCQHTDSFSGVSLMITIVSIIASIVTIAGLIAVIRDILAHKNKVKCHKDILHDFIRHILINMGIVEVIRIKMQENGCSYCNSYPEEGVFKRLAFLPEDYNFEKFSIGIKHFQYTHEIELSMRNLNIAVEVACSHFLNPVIPEEIKQSDLDDIIHRSIILIGRFNLLYSMIQDPWYSNCSCLEKSCLIQCLVQRSRNKPKNNLDSLYQILQKSYGEKLKYIDYSDIQIPQRTDEHKKFLKINEITDLMNRYIKYRYDYVRIIPFPKKKNK